MPCTHGQLIYGKGGTTTQCQKTPFNKRCWEDWTATCKTLDNFQHHTQKRAQDGLPKCEAEHYKTPRGKQAEQSLTQMAAISFLIHLTE